MYRSNQLLIALDLKVCPISLDLSKSGMGIRQVP
tara:strand:- start:616 stop:717 length:102 start_codon:yes stop_codon:yes gene_type:complete